MMIYKLLFIHCNNMIGFPGGSEVKASACNAGDLGSIPGSDPWVGKIPWRRKWQPTPVFLPGEFHGQRNLTGYSLWGHKELDTTEQLHFHNCSSIFTYLNFYSIFHSECANIYSNQ